MNRKGKSLISLISILFFSGSILFGQPSRMLDIKTAKNTKAKKTALSYLESQESLEKYGKISDQIWNFAELGMQEFKSSALLMETLEAEGFAIEKNVAGMPTCFIASWGSGKPVIGILGEFDALPMISQKPGVTIQDPLVEGGPGHGCGHNMMGSAGIAAAIATKRSMEENNIQGTIRFYGSPAEETVISRPYMVKAGVFEDVDAVIDNHASSRMGTGYGVGGNAVISVVFTFSGKTAHSAGAPWDGRSALDAVEIMNISTNFLREHLDYTHRMHYVVIKGGEAPNVVPDKASVWYYVRNTDERVEDMYERVVNCAKGAALASGTTLEDIRILTGVHQRHANRGMAELIQSNIQLVGMPEWTEEEHAYAKELQRNLEKKETGYPTEFNKLYIPSGVQVGGGSSDVGEVTLVTPTATLRFPGGVPGAIGHHWSAVSAYCGTASWKGLNAGAKVMAASAIDLFTDPAKLKKIQEEFKEYSAEHPYRSFLDEDSTPPLDLNKELMDRFRSALEEF